MGESVERKLEVDDVDVACIEEACAAEKEECMLDVRKSFRLCLW